MRLLRSLAALGPVLCATLCAANAHACTVCDSPTGHQLRAGLFNGHFLQTSLLVAAPVPALVAAILLLHRAMPDLPELTVPEQSTPDIADDLTFAEPAL